MEQVSGLYNPGFVGSQFHWWLGQVADSRSWRDNQPKSHFLSKMIFRVGVIDIKLESWASMMLVVLPYHLMQLPWAQVMYPITAGGGQGGSFQTPGIKQGNFVFGFFLDGVTNKFQSSWVYWVIMQRQL